MTFGYCWPGTEKEHVRLHCLTSQWWQVDGLWLSTSPQAINAGQAQAAGDCDWESSVQQAGRENWLKEGQEMLKQTFVQQKARGRIENKTFFFFSPVETGVASKLWFSWA